MVEKLHGLVFYKISRRYFKESPSFAILNFSSLIIEHHVVIAANNTTSQHQQLNTYDSVLVL